MEKPPNRFVAAPADLSENAGLDATGWSGMSHVLHLEGAMPPFFRGYIICLHTVVVILCLHVCMYHVYSILCTSTHIIATGSFGGFNIYRRISRWLKSEIVLLVVSMDLFTPSFACRQAIHFVLNSWELPRPEIRIHGSIKGKVFNHRLPSNNAKNPP